MFANLFAAEKRPFVILGLLVFGLAVVHPASDFVVYYSAGWNLWHGGWISVYQPQDFTPHKYHPASTYLFVPFSVFPWIVSKTVWCALNGFFFANSIQMLQREMRVNWKLIAAGIFLVLHGLTWQLKFSNVTLLILWLLVVTQTHKNDWMKAAAITVLIVLKTYWIILLVPLLLRKRRSVFVLASALLVGFSLVPFLGGWESGLSSYRLWVATLMDPLHAHNYPKNDNQSYFGFLWRLYGSFSPSFLIMLFLGCLGVGLMWLVSFLRLPEAVSESIGVYTMVPVVLWTGPLSWFHSQLLLLPLFLFLSKFSYTHWLLFLSWLLFNGTAQFIIGRPLSLTLNYWAVPVLGFLTILVALWIVARREGKPLFKQSRG